MPHSDPPRPTSRHRQHDPHDSFRVPRTLTGESTRSETTAPDFHELRVTPDDDEPTLLGGFAIDIDDTVIADALASVERHRHRANEAPTVIVESDDSIDFMGDSDEETNDAPTIADESFDVELDVFGGNEAEESAIDVLQAELARIRAELSVTKLDLETAQAELAELRTVAEEAEESANRAKRVARKTKQALETEAEQRKRVTATLQQARERAQRAEDRLESTEAARLKAETSLKERTDDLQRAQRDVERLKSRHDQAIAQASSAATEKAAKEMLPVLDSLSMALSHSNAEPEALLEGVRITVHQLNGALTRVGLTSVDAQPGAAFDPSVHEAMQALPSDEIAAGMVLTELQAGFRLHGRLVRAARVIVSSGPLPSETVAASQDSTTAQLDAAPVEEASADPLDEDTVQFNATEIESKLAPPADDAT